VLEAGADFVKIRCQNSNKELIENTLRADRDYLFVPITFFKSRPPEVFRRVPLEDVERDYPCVDQALE